jgi:hypothetical protein
MKGIRFLQITRNRLLRRLLEKRLRKERLSEAPDNRLEKRLPRNGRLRKRPRVMMNQLWVWEI